MEHPQGIAIDWITNHLYFTDVAKRTVNIAYEDGSRSFVIVKLPPMSEPWDIVVAPLKK